MRLPAKALLSAAVCLLAMLSASANSSAWGGFADLRQWEIHELPFPAYEYPYSNDLDMYVDADGMRYFFAGWYEGMVFGDGEWSLVDLSDTFDELGLYIDYISYAVDHDGNIHFVALTYIDEIVYGTDASGEWVTETVDDIGMIGGGWSYVPRPKVVVDDQGSAHLCYHNMDDGHDLRYATNAHGNWTVWSIEQALNSSSHYAMELDADRQPHIAYWNYNTTQLMYVTLDDDWSVEPVTAVDPYTDLLSVTLDVSDDGRAHIVYGVLSSPPHEIYDWKGLYYTVENEGGWDETLIDGSWSSDYSYMDVSGQLDGEEVLHLFYYDSFNRDLVYANNKAGTFERQRVDAVDYVGSRSAMALDPEENVHVAYLNETSRTVKYAIGNATGTSSAADDGGEDLFPVVAVVTLVATGVAALAVVAWRPGKAP